MPLKVFGRKIVLFAQLFFFAAGSAICGAAPSMGVLIAGRSEYLSHSRSEDPV